MGDNWYIMSNACREAGLKWLRSEPVLIFIAGSVLSYTLIAATNRAKI